MGRERQDVFVANGVFPIPLLPDAAEPMGGS
jgi:hypothetical protein